MQSCKSNVLPLCAVPDNVCVFSLFLCIMIFLFGLFFYSNISSDKMLYSDADLEESMNKIETINFHQEIEANGVKFWCYNAGHVLGAAMYMIEIAGVKVTCHDLYYRVQKRLHHNFFFFFLHFSVFDIMYRWSMMKNIHSPNLVGIGSWWPEIWPHEYLISPIEIIVNWLGSKQLRTRSIYTDFSGAN